MSISRRWFLGGLAAAPVALPVLAEVRPIDPPLIDFEPVGELSFVRPSEWIWVDDGEAGA